METLRSDARASSASPARHLIVLCGMPWAAVHAFEWLTDLAGWRPLGSGLLPFDGFATYQELFRAALGLGALLCALRIAGVLRWGWYLATGVGAALCAVALATRGMLLPFWSVSALVGGTLAMLAWLLLRPGRRFGSGWIRLVAAVAVAPLVFATSLTLLLDLALAAEQRFPPRSFPTPDGGTVSAWSWFLPGWGDATTGNVVVYTPPGWWVRAERIAELAPDEALRGVSWYADGERRAVLLETSARSLAAKRLVRERVRGPELVSWKAPYLDFPCLWRGFEAPGSRAHERLVPVERAASWDQAEGDLFVDLRFGVRYCERPGTWRATGLDLSRDRVREEAHDLPLHAPRTLVYSAQRADFMWTFDLERTLAANPDLRPLPLGDVTASLRVVRVPAPASPSPELFPHRLPARLEEVLARDGAQVVCRAEAALRQLEPVELPCHGTTLAPSHFVVTGLWGDPNPGLVAVSLPEPRTLPEQRRYLLLPLGRDFRLPFSYGRDLVETVFLRLERR